MVVVQYVVEMSTKISERKVVGDFGELLITFLLTQLGVQANWVGFSNLGYDVIVPFPDGKIFRKPTAISIKTRKKKKWKGIPPNKQKFAETQAALKKDGWDFWIGWVFYGVKDYEIWFKICLIPSNIITNEWFVAVGKKRQISIQKIEEESKINPKILTLTSKEPI